MNGFVGEFLILSGAFQAKAIYGILAASGVIWSAFYMLWLYQRTFYGIITQPGQRGAARCGPARAQHAVAACRLALVMGVFPSFWMNSIDASVAGILDGQTGVYSAPTLQVKVNTVLK